MIPNKAFFTGFLNLVKDVTILAQGLAVTLPRVIASSELMGVFTKNIASFGYYTIALYLMDLI